MSGYLTHRYSLTAGNFFNAVGVTASFKFGGNELVDHFESEIQRNKPGGDTKNIRIVMQPCQL